MRLQICSSLKLCGSTVWQLNPNMLRGDLTWGLPKLQIEWSKGLAFESKHVGGLIWDFKSVQVSNWVVQRFSIWIQTCWGVIWLGDYPSLKSSGPTAWHLNPNTLGRLIWDFKFVQVSNWLVQRFGIWIQTRWGVIWLEDYPSLKSSGLTFHQIAI